MALKSVPFIYGTADPQIAMNLGEGSRDVAAFTMSLMNLASFPIVASLAFNPEM